MAGDKTTRTFAGHAETIFLAVCVVVALTALTLMWFHRGDFEFLIEAARAEWAAFSAEFEATLEELRELLAGNGPEREQDAD